MKQKSVQIVAIFTSLGFIKAEKVTNSQTNSGEEPTVMNKIFGYANLLKTRITGDETKTETNNPENVDAEPTAPGVLGTFVNLRDSVTSRIFGKSTADNVETENSQPEFHDTETKEENVDKNETLELPRKPETFKLTGNQVVDDQLDSLRNITSSFMGKFKFS